ncbi:hypothetical protein ACO22_05300, partial [Paracoccidioides brasiliensis]
IKVDRKGRRATSELGIVPEGSPRIRCDQATGDERTTALKKSCSGIT